MTSTYVILIFDAIIDSPSQDGYVKQRLQNVIIQYTDHPPRFPTMATMQYRAETEKKSDQPLKQQARRSALLEVNLKL